MPASTNLQYIALFFLILALGFEFLFTVIVITGTVYDHILDKKFQKKKSKAQLEKEKFLKMNNSIIKYIFINSSEQKLTEGKILTSSKELRTKTSIAKVHPNDI